MTHLEQLLVEYYQWKGYFVQHNLKVGRLRHGGYEMELDIVAFDYRKKHLIHLEPSIDSHNWATRETRYRKKFKAGRKYIPTDVLNGLAGDIKLEQVAILIDHPKNRHSIGGGKLMSLDEKTKEICDAIREHKKIEGNAIPEKFRLLRTIQLVQNGYRKKL